MGFFKTKITLLDLRSSDTMISRSVHSTGTVTPSFHSHVSEPSKSLWSPQWTSGIASLGTGHGSGKIRLFFTSEHSPPH